MQVQISDKLRFMVKCGPKPGYRIAQDVGMAPSALSRLICGIDPVKLDDPRIIAVGRVVGLSAAECFEPHNEV